MIQISSDVAFSCVMLGMVLIYAELCAPGVVIAGALGGISVLGGAWVLAQRHLTAPGLACLGAGLLLAATAIRLRSYRVWTGLSLVFLCAGSSLLVDGGTDSISLAVSIPLPALWGVATIVLGRLALVARARKREL